MWTDRLGATESWSGQTFLVSICIIMTPSPTPPLVCACSQLLRALLDYFLTALEHWWPCELLQSELWNNMVLCISKPWRLYALANAPKFSFSSATVTNINIPSPRLPNKSFAMLEFNCNRQDVQWVLRLCYFKTAETVELFAITELLTMLSDIIIIGSQSNVGTLGLIFFLSLLSDGC